MKDSIKIELSHHHDFNSLRIVNNANEVNGEDESENHLTNNIKSICRYYEQSAIARNGNSLTHNGDNIAGENLINDVGPIQLKEVQSKYSKYLKKRRFIGYHQKSCPENVSESGSSSQLSKSPNNVLQTNTDREIIDCANAREDEANAANWLQHFRNGPSTTSSCIENILLAQCAKASQINEMPERLNTVGDKRENAVKTKSTDKKRATSKRKKRAKLNVNSNENFAEHQDTASCSPVKNLAHIFNDQFSLIQKPDPLQGIASGVMDWINPENYYKKLFHYNATLYQNGIDINNMMPSPWFPAPDIPNRFNFPLSAPYYGNYERMNPEMPEHIMDGVKADQLKMTDAQFSLYNDYIKSTISKAISASSRDFNENHRANFEAHDQPVNIESDNDTEPEPANGNVRPIKIDTSALPIESEDEDGTKINLSEYDFEPSVHSTPHKQPRRILNTNGCGRLISSSSTRKSDEGISVVLSSSSTTGRSSTEETASRSPNATHKISSGSEPPLDAENVCSDPATPLRRVEGEQGDTVLSQRNGKFIKDQAYWERRRKNNEAAKKSRDARRAKEEEVASKAANLEEENMKLRAQITVLKTETAKLQYLLFSNGGGSGSPLGHSIKQSLS